MSNKIGSTSIVGLSGLYLGMSFDSKFATSYQDHLPLKITILIWTLERPPRGLPRGRRIRVIVKPVLKIRRFLEDCFTHEKYINGRI